MERTINLLTHEFIERFEQVVVERITTDQMSPEIEIDAEIPLYLVKPAYYKIIKQFEPFGPANMKPLFVSRRLYDYQGGSAQIKDTHLKIVASQQHGIIVDGIGFGLADKYAIVAEGPFDMVYTIEENEYNGNTRLQVRVVDVRKSE